MVARPERGRLSGLEMEGGVYQTHAGERPFGDDAGQMGGTEGRFLHRENCDANKTDECAEPKFRLSLVKKSATW